MKNSISMVVYLSIFIGILCSIGTIMARCGKFSWIFDLFSHFPFQYCLGILLAIIASLLFQKYVLSLVFLLFFLLNFLQLMPYCFPPICESAQKVPQNPLNQTKIMFINVHKKNIQYNKVISYITKEQPDIVILTEIDTIWNKQLSPLNETYTYQQWYTRDFDDVGIMLLSKIPIRSCETLMYDNKKAVPSIVCNLELSGKKITIFGIHTCSPIAKKNLLQRNRQLRILAQKFKTIEHASIIIGDFNITPWSFFYRKYFLNDNFLNVRKGRGIVPSWPTFVPFFIRIPIDQILVNNKVEVNSFEKGPDVGSDHYPILIKFLT